MQAICSWARQVSASGPRREILEFVRAMHLSPRKESKLFGIWLFETTPWDGWLARAARPSQGVPSYSSCLDTPCGTCGSREVLGWSMCVCVLLCVCVGVCVCGIQTLFRIYLICRATDAQSAKPQMHILQATAVSSILQRPVARHAL